MVFSFNPASILGPEFYAFLLPWIFTFAIVYGLLSKLDLFEKKSPKVNVALAFVVAFFVTGAAGPQLAAFFINLFGGASVYLAGILVILLFATMLGGKDFFNKTKYILIVAVIGIALFLGSSGYFTGYAVVSSDVAMLAFWLIIIVIAVYMVTHEDEKKEETKTK